MHIPSMFSNKYFCMINIITAKFEKEAAESYVKGGLTESEVLKKIQNAIFDEKVYEIFCSREKYGFGIISPRTFIPLSSVHLVFTNMQEKETFWKYVGDRKKEFLRECRRWKKRRKILGR